MKNKLLPISFILKDYKLSKYIVYSAIKTDPSFPAINLGPKKNYRIDASKFEEWLLRRSINTNHSKIPTAKDLLMEFAHERRK
ncbi:MAG: hypothetical protein HQK52_18915 [Oligoflexia bacterium]|nr:hypothetical protein [Oligoflexia bacterium]